MLQSVFAKQEQAHFVVILQSAKGQNRHGFDSRFDFELADRTEMHGGGEV